MASEDGGRVMNPLDRNVVDKMAVLGIISLPEKILKIYNKILSLSKFSIEFNVQGDFHNDVTKLTLQNISPNIPMALLPSFFVESLGDDVFMFGGMGNIVKMSMVDGTVQVKTNLNQIIQDQEYTSIVRVLIIHQGWV